MLLDKLIAGSIAKAMTTLLFLIMQNTIGMAQADFSGEYYLTGIHEMAAGFKFTKDGHFQFYYSYGAVDRVAEGTYLIEGNTLKLKSNKEPGKDFTIQKQNKQGSGYTIKVVHPNKALVRNIKCVLFVGTEKTETYTNSDGEVHSNLPKADKIYLQHGLYPDIVTQIKDETNTNNYFEVALNPLLEKVSFKGIDFSIDGKVLRCLPNYFMPFENIKFVKQ